MTWLKSVRDFFIAPGEDPSAGDAHGEAGPPALPGTTERFGDSVVDAAIGDAIVASRPDARASIARVRDLLPDLTRVEKDRLVDQVVRRFALYVLDLPASEAAHHARAWGLFDHSLDAALLALEHMASGGRLSPTGDPVKDRRLAPRYRYAAFLCGLFHDLGKISDVVVRAPGAGDWNELEEPLAAYAKRHGLAGVFGHHCHVPGRGKTRHAVAGPLLYERVGGSAPLEYLRDVLFEVLDAKNRKGEAKRSSAAQLVAEAVALADRADSRQDAGASTPDDAPPVAMTPGAAPTSPLPPSVPAAVPKSASIVELFGRALDLVGLSGAADEVLGLNDVVAVAYPAGVASVIERMRALWASSDGRVAALTADASGVRALAGELAALSALRLDAASKEWKHQASVVDDAKNRTMIDVVVVERRVAGKGVPRSPYEVEILSPTDHRAAGQAPPVSDGPLFIHYDGPAVVGKIHEELVAGRLTANVYRADCYITVNAVYVVRDTLERIARSLGMDGDLSKHLSPFLTAMGRAPETLRTSGNLVHHWIRTRPDSEKPVGAIALKTCAFLSRADLDRLGFYPEEIVVEPPLKRPHYPKRGLESGVS